VRFSDLVDLDQQPADARTAHRTAVDTDSYSTQLIDDPRNNGFVSGLLDRRRGKRVTASRRGFLRGTIATAAATTAVSAANLFGPARKVEAQSGVVGTYPRRILQFCPPYNSGDNCQPGCGSSPICTDCCGADGFFRNDPGRGYSLYAGGCGDGDIADGWLWRFKGKCGNCSEIEYRCSDGYVQTDTGPAPFICRSVTACVPLAEGEAPGAALPDAARSTNWRPAGALEVAIDQGGAVAINGWIADGSGVPIQMRIRANNAIKHFGTAALPRPDINSRVRGAGPNTGFAVSFPVEPGEYEFCVDALQGVLNATIGCVRLTIGSGGSARGSGSRGSIAPPPAPAPTTNDTPAAPTGATPATPAPPAGAIVLPERSGRSDSRAMGAVQIIRRSGPTSGFVSGWAGDPDSNDPVFIEVLADGESVAVTRTDLPRPDVAQAFGALSPTTGFAITFTLPAEATEVCVVAVSPDDGRRQPLGCQELGAAPDPAEPDDSESSDEERPEPPTASGSAANATPVVYGGIDNVSIAGTEVTVDGWTFDPNDRDRTISVTPQGSHELEVSAVASNGQAMRVGRQTIVIT